MNKDLRNKAVELRVNNNLSYGAIRDKLSVSKSTLSYWLKDFPLTKSRILELRRAGWTKGEASRERYRVTMREKRKNANEEIYEKYRTGFNNIPRISQLIAGLMLYLGEGDKKNVSRVVLANTDVRIIKFFIKWLIEFMGVSLDEIRIQLHLYEDMDILREKKYWQKELALGDDQFYKIQVRKIGKNSFTYSESYRHGTCSVFLLGVKTKREIMMAMKAFVDIYLM